MSSCLMGCPEFPDHLLLSDRGTPDAEAGSDRGPAIDLPLKPDRQSDGPRDHGTADQVAVDAPVPDGPSADHGPPDLSLVDGPPADLMFLEGGVCPSICSSCAGGVCQINAAECDNTCQCPAGLSCVFDCAADNVCAGAIDCSQGQDCQITCGQDSCSKLITCGSGDCVIQCLDADSCAMGIDCTAAGSCQIACINGACPKSTFCGDGPCDVSCQGGSCMGTINCTSSCRCSVSCSADSCFKATLCPTDCQSSQGCDPLTVGCSPTC